MSDIDEHDEEVEEQQSDEVIKEEEDDGPQVSGWADAMSKILGSKKPQKKKQLILSRAKKDYEIRKPVVAGPVIEVVETEPGQSKPSNETETELDSKAKKSAKKTAKKAKKRKANDVDGDEGDDEQEKDSFKKHHKIALKQKRLQKQWENINRTKPDNQLDREIERELKKIATKGVVELFNAVNLQKKTLGRKLRTAHKSEFKRDKVLSETKDLFEDALDKVKVSKTKR